MDCHAFAAVTNGDLQAFSLGTLEGFGDDKVRAKIRSRIQDSAQFDDLMLELSIAAFHQSEGHKVTPYERDAWPDMQVQQPGHDEPLFVECKRVKSSRHHRLEKVLLKANNQLKVVPADSFGVALLDITASVGVQRLADEIPEPVQSVRDVVSRILSGPKNRSIDRAIITWDDCGTIGEPPDRMVVALRRRLLSVDHDPVPGVRRVPESLKLFAGATALVAVEFGDKAAA